METTRRDVIFKTLFGTGYVGLSALATGLPLSVFMRPTRAWAQEAEYKCFDKNKAQYLILSTSSSGDPVNANVPGSYEFPDIAHAADPAMAATPMSLGGKKVIGAQAWSTLPQAVLDRTSFFHHATYTNNHPNLPKVMRLMGATYKQEMLPSILAKNLAPCLGTVQIEPVSVGAGEILTFEGRGLPNLNPTGLRDVLTQPVGPLSRLRKLRDTSLDKMHALLKQSGTVAQRKYIDSLAVSRNQARSISDELLNMLGDIRSDKSDGQVIAAAALIKMNVSPVIAIRIDFGGDNHSDPDLTTREVPQTVAGIQRIGELMQTLASYGLSDKVTFAMYNVFGRTLKKLGTAGRDHWASHHATVMIGKPIKAGVIGGLEPKLGDYYASAINSTTGAKGGDIGFGDTLGAMGKTLGVAVGCDPKALDLQISQGKVVAAALA